MKKLILPNVPGLRFRMQDLEYIQQGVLMQQSWAVMQYLPANFAGLVIIEGCEIVKSGTTYTMTAGKVFYKPTSVSGLVDVYEGGEILEVLGQSFVSDTEPQWEVYQIEEGTGPRAFKDGNQYDIDLEFKARLKTGTGLAQWDLVRRLEHIQFNKTKEMYEIITIPKLPPNNFFTNYFNANGVGLPYKKYEGFEIATGAVNSVDMAGKTILGINFRDTSEADVRLKSTDAGASALNTYFPIGVGVSWLSLIGSFVGKLKVMIGAGELPDGTFTSNGSLPTLSRVFQAPTAGSDYGFFGSQSLFDLRQPSVVSIIIQKVSEIPY